MDALSTDTLREIVRRVFPDLRFGGDPDLERYFDFRSHGRLREALAIYNGPLKTRYPNDASRVQLLKLYREHNPAWLELQDRLIVELGGRLAMRLKHNIDILVSPIENADLSNAFKALSVVESLLSRIPVKDEAAVKYLDGYAQLSHTLNYRADLVSRARDLVSEYVAMAGSEEAGETDFMARAAAIEEKRQAEEARRRAARAGVIYSTDKNEGYDFVAQSEAHEKSRREAEEREAKAHYFDLSRVKFSPEDKAKVEIDSRIQRKEDKVLAYCWKYWDLVRDPAFERIVFLYSRKYETQNYEIFRTIKVARARGFTDDEILTAVSTLLSSSYSYSVSGDLYMQATWRKLKARAEAERIAAQEARAEKGLADESPRTASVRNEVAAKKTKAAAEKPRPSAEKQREPLLRSNFAAPAPVEGPRSRLAAVEAKPGLRSNFGAPESAPELKSRFPEAEGKPALRSNFAAPESSPELKSRFPEAEEKPALRSNFSAPESTPELKSRFPEAEAEPGFRSRIREEVPEHAAEPREETPADDRTAFLLSARQESAERAQERIEERIKERADRTERPETARKAEIEASAAAAKDGASSAGGKSGTTLVRVKGKSGRAHGRQLLAQTPYQDQMPAVSVHGGSVSDRIKKLSGKAYDVYRELFIDRVRDSIHRYLLANQTRPHRFFDESINHAEDGIFGFMADHYEDPYLDWESSDTRKNVEALGFSVPSIDPIIEAWYKKL